MSGMKLFPYPKLFDAAVLAGEAIIKVYNTENFEVESKGDDSPLTQADKQAHQIISGEIKRFSRLPILSEEGEQYSYLERAQWKSYWLVDPLDGTKEFIKRNGEFTVNIALIENGIPVLGVIYVPVSQVIYYGSKENGAFKGQVSFKSEKEFEIKDVLALPQPLADSPFILVGSRSHMSEETMAYKKELESEHSHIEMVSCGSSLKLCMVAEGKAHEYPRFAPTMEWDTGAGDAICRAAGFKVLAYPAKTPLKYNKENLLNPFFLVC